MASMSASVGFGVRLNRSTARHRLHRAEVVDADDLAADLRRHAQHGRLRVRHGEVHGELIAAGHDVARIEPPGELADHLVLRPVLRLRAEFRGVQAMMRTLCITLSLAFITGCASMASSDEEPRYVGRAS